MRNKINLSAKCAMLTASYYLLIYPTIIMFSSYMVLSGFSTTKVSLLLSIFGALTICVKPIAANIIDKSHCHILAYSMIISIAIGCFVFFGAENKTMVHALIYVLMVSTASSILMEQVDSWVLKLSVTYPEIDYAKQRSSGSFSFALIGLVFGSLIAKLGIQITPYIVIVILAFFGLFCAMLPEPEAGSTKKTSWKDIKSLFTNKYLMWFIILYALGASVIDITDNYIGVMILEKGGTTAYTGLHDFLKAMIEFFVMFRCSKLLEKYGAQRIMIIGMFGLFIKAISASLMPTAALVVATCITQAFSFPLVIPARMEILKETVPANQLAMSISISAVITSLVVTFISNPLIGALVPSIGTSMSVCVVCCTALISAFGIMFLKKESNQAKYG